MTHPLGADRRPSSLRTSTAAGLVPHDTNVCEAKIVPPVLPSPVPPPPPLPFPPRPPAPQPPTPPSPVRRRAAHQRDLETTWGLDGGYVPSCDMPGLYSTEASRWGLDEGYVPPAEPAVDSDAEPFLLFS